MIGNSPTIAHEAERQLIDAVSLAESIGITPRRVRQIASSLELGQKYGRSGLWLFSYEDADRIRSYVVETNWRNTRRIDSP